MVNIELKEKKKKPDCLFTEKFTDRLAEARRNMNLDKSQVVEYLEKINVKVSLASYCRWEQGSRTPKPENIDALARVLHVSRDWLCGKTDVCEPAVQESMESRELKRDNLYMRRGEPVWIGYMYDRWGIVSLTEDVIYLSDGSKLPFYLVEEPIRYFPAPLCYGVESLKKPIPLFRLKYYERIWVQGIGPAPTKRLNGWFWFNNERNCFMGENKATVNLKDYAVTWIAYEDICE